MRAALLSGFSVIAILLGLARPDAASAQSCRWTTRIAGGVALPTDGSVATPAPGGPETDSVGIETNAGVVAAFEMSRSIACRIELQGGVLIAFAPIGISGESASARTRLSGIQFGVAYHPWQFARGDIYVGPIIGGFARDRVVTTLPNGFRSITIPGGWGVGAQVGYRHNPSKKSTLDVNLRWQDLRLPVFHNSRLNLSPFVLTAGVVIRH